MKKCLLFLFFVGTVVSVDASKKDEEDVFDSLRYLTGRVEDLEKNIEEMRKEIAYLKGSMEKKELEDSSQKEIEQMADKNPEEVLKEACGMIEENNTEEARKILTAFVTKNPTSIYCGMFLFYAGNCYFMEKDYENAAIEYMKGFKANPGGSKAAETLYKLALCFKNLKDRTKYKSTLEKIVSDYAGDFKTKAAAELKKIK